MEYKQYSDHYASLTSQKGATHFIDPTGDLSWKLRYVNTTKYNLMAASVIDSFNYILSANITDKQAQERIKEMRKTLRAANKQLKITG